MASTSTRRWVALWAALGLSAALAGCGGGNGEAGKSAAAVLADAKAATAAAGTVHVSGSGSSNGQSVSFDVTAGDSAGGGTVTLGGFPIYVVLGAGNLYLRGSKATWSHLTGSTAAGSLLAGRWVYVAAGDPSFASITDLLNLPALLAQLTPHGAVHKSAVRVDLGQRVIPITGQAGATLEVDATGRPFIAAVVDAGRRVTLSGFGTSRAPAVPSGATPLAGLSG